MHCRCSSFPSCWSNDEHAISTELQDRCECHERAADKGQVLKSSFLVMNKKFQDGLIICLCLNWWCEQEWDKMHKHWSGCCVRERQKGRWVASLVTLSLHNCTAQGMKHWEQTFWKRSSTHCFKASLQMFDKINTKLGPMQQKLEISSQILQSLVLFPSSVALLCCWAAASSASCCTCS